MSNTELINRVQNGGGVQRRDPVDALMNSMKSEMIRSLPNHIDGDRFMRLLMTQLRVNQDLAQAAISNRASLIAALMEVSALGLEPEPALGQIYLIPRKRHGKLEVTVQTGYRGLLELARRSGRVRSCSARIVGENDEFEINEGTSPSIVHKPCVRGDRGEPLGAYATATIETAGGTEVLQEWMSAAQIDRVRDQSSAAGGRGPWADHWGEMARKTVFRRLAKWLPLSPEKAKTDAESQRQSVSLQHLVGGPSVADDFAARSLPPAPVHELAEPEPDHDPETGEVRPMTDNERLQAGTFNPDPEADTVLMANPDAATVEALATVDGDKLSALWRTMGIDGEPTRYLVKRRERIAAVAGERGISAEELADMVGAL